MSNDKSLAIIPRTMTDVQSLAEVLSKSTLLPDALKGKVPDIVVQILAGQELGLPPMASIRGVYVVQGKPVLAADTMVGLVLASGLAEYFTCTEDTDARVTYETKRKGSPVAQKLSWSVEDTKRAGLQAKDTWRAYPRAMMKARAKAALARDAYPDVLASTHDPDEVQVPAREQSRPAPVADRVSFDVIEDAEVVDEVAGGLAAIAEATTVDALGVLAKTFATLKVSATGKATLLDAFKARKAVLVVEPQAAAS